MLMTSAKFIKGIRGTDDIVEDGIPQILFVGRSNVGKSSIINALTGVPGLARVGKKPGKTTEINFFLVNNNLYFVDLPGYGFARASLEEREKTRKMIVWYLGDSGVKPRRVIMVVDSKIGITALDRDMITILTAEGHPTIIVANKVDQLSGSEQSLQIERIRQECSPLLVIPYSSKFKKGREQLLQSLT